MAYRVGNINPIDLKASTGVGVAIPFNQAFVFRTVYTTQEQTRYNLINYVLTNPGERVFEPTFGLGLRKKLFEQMTTNYVEGLKDLIIGGIESYFTNIQILDSSIEPYPDQNIVRVSITYKVVTTNQQDEITINLENG
jgi:hypothetical protein